MARNSPMPSWVPALVSLLRFLLISTFATSVVAERLVEDDPHVGPSSSAFSRVCEKTRFPKVCAGSLLEASDMQGTVNEMQLLHMSFNSTLRRFSRALYLTSGIGGRLAMHPRERSAYDDCLELLDDSVYALSNALSYVSASNGVSSSSPEDVVTWLSSAMTNQDTCKEGFDGVEAVAGAGAVKFQVTEHLRDLSEMVSNCLAIFVATQGQDFSSIPIENKRRRLMSWESDPSHDRAALPMWLTRRERRLLDSPATAINADIVVSQDGNGTCKTISEAIKRTPDYSPRRIIIYVKAGRYEENILKVGRKKTNLMFVGDGRGKTVITGRKSVLDNMTTFHTASFAASGSGFIARDMTFENYAGPEKHQAVALRVGADHAVVYRCNIIGYQDTLYVHSNRQFFRECDVYGTVDFIFGNAAVVFQNCSLYARKPMSSQKNTITAQNRKDPNQNTGMSIHACRILATPDLAATTPSGTYPTFLGRPWKLYSRVVYLMSYLGDHVHPRGWLEWNATFALDTLYYGEYLNFGPRGPVDQRIKWPGYRVINSSEEAGKFTVGQFIFGLAWLPSTGVAFLAGLSV